MKNLVSVIIPVYNTEQYLCSCVESILNQSYKELEIILVDDGSTDGSPRICDEFAQRDFRVKVIHKKNEGLGYTRNCGLKYATGKYVSFFDSDDVLESDAYEYCVREMEEKCVDACYFGRKTFSERGKYVINENLPEKLVYEGTEVREEFSKHYFGWFQYEVEFPYIKESVCCALYRRDIIESNNIRFPSERECLSEDAFFNLDICNVANKVIIIPQNFYNYRYNPNSLTKKYDKERFRRIIGYYNKLLEYTAKFPEVEDVQNRINYKIFSLVRGMIKMEIENSGWMEMAETIQYVRRVVHSEAVEQIVTRMIPERMGKSTKIFYRWLKTKRCITIYFFYKMRKMIFNA